MGLRDPVAHAAGAYLSSYRDSWDIAAKLDPEFDASDTQGGSGLQDSINEANSYMGTEADFDFVSKPFKQKDVSTIVDKALLDRLETDWQGEISLGHI